MIEEQHKLQKLDMHKNALGDVPCKISILNPNQPSAASRCPLFLLINDGREVSVDSCDYLAVVSWCDNQAVK